MSVVGGCCFLGAAAIRVIALEPSISPAVAAAPFASPLRLRSGGGDADGSSRAAAQNTCMLIVIITASWYGYTVRFVVVDMCRACDYKIISS